MPSRATTPRKTRRHPWARLPDEALLDVRLCDLGVTLDGSPLARDVGSPSARTAGSARNGFRRMACLASRCRSTSRTRACAGSSAA